MGRAPCVDYVGGKDGLGAQRCGTETLEDATLAVDRDNRDQRKHGADGDQYRSENRQSHADETAGRECGRCEVAASHSVYLSQPEAVATLIAQAAAGAAER